MHRLEIDKVSIRFGGVYALQDVSMHVDPGELVAIIGPNGAGKTSLINCISGVYRPASGRIRFDGRDVTRLPPATRTRLGLARTFQNIALFQHMTVLENMMV
ncbi:MAG: ATP-binding cassette domain-containing protein, partial [Myxococcales bacterium]|nr:ATP-binding cassette domain-containing protein [Myxococcales bacterium]